MGTKPTSSFRVYGLFWLILFLFLGVAGLILVVR